MKHQVDKVGVRANVRRFYWHQVEGYNFTDHKALPDVGCLNVKISGHDYWLSLPFHRSEVNEPELSALMDRLSAKDVSSGDINPEVHLRRLRERQRWYKRNKYISLALLAADVVAVLWVWKAQVVNFDWVLNCSFLWAPMFLLVIFVMTKAEADATKKIAKLDTPPAG